MFNPTGPIPIQGYHAWKDEYETAAAWDRPVRKFHSDSPFYPWMPKPPDQYRVSFKLNFH